jgi:hypothetical protein
MLKILDVFVFVVRQGAQPQLSFLRQMARTYHVHRVYALKQLPKAYDWAFEGLDAYFCTFLLCVRSRFLEGRPKVVVY